MNAGSSEGNDGIPLARVDEETQASLAFEDRLSQLSTTFIRITADEIDREIVRWLGRLGLALRFDRSTVGQVNPDDGMLYTTHSWAREGMQPLPQRLDFAKLVPWLCGKIFADEIVAIRVADAPAEAAKDVAFARLVGNKTIVSVPLKIGGEIVGVVTFGSVRSEQTWSDRTIRRLRLVSEVFGNALQRKRAVEEIRRFEQEMRQVSRVAIMGELTVSLAHELSQPLGAILNNAQAARHMLASDPPDLDEASAALDDIIRDNSRAVEIIVQVRSLFQGGETRKSHVDMKQVLLDIERLLRHEAGVKGISLRLVVPDPLPSVVGQRTQLMQLLLNLVLNAFDAVCESHGAKREVEIIASYDGAGCIRVAVRDSGVGIGPSNLPRLFDAFFTTKKKGIGLGLAISRSIVENHGGRLWAAQNPDQGATLEFELPAETAEREGN